MDNFIGSLIFLLPGVMVYFWLQSFGVSPSVKHTPTEFTAISALLWLPVSLVTILTINLMIKFSKIIVSIKPIWTVNDLKDASAYFIFLAVFLFLSALISFLLSALWAKWGFVFHQNIINKIRGWRGIAPFSETSSVWDEVFGKNQPQVVEITKLDKPENKIIGCIKKVSRTFEPERNIYLEEVDYFTDLVKNNQIPISNTFCDTKSGIYIKIFDSEAIKKAQE